MIGIENFGPALCAAMARLCRREETAIVSERLVDVRVGMVLASYVAGVPNCKAHIAAGGAVTATHPDMVRYLMRIREAYDLVIAAAAHALSPVRQDVSVDVLNMREPIKIVDLA